MDRNTKLTIGALVGAVIAAAPCLYFLNEANKRMNEGREAWTKAEVTEKTDLAQAYMNIDTLMMAGDTQAAHQQLLNLVKEQNLSLRVTRSKLEMDQHLSPYFVYHMTQEVVGKMNQIDQYVGGK